MSLPQSVSYQMFNNFKNKLVGDLKGALKGGKRIGLVRFICEVIRVAQMPNKKVT